MPIQMSCPQCLEVYRFPDSAVGKRARCKQCSTVISIAAAPAADDPLGVSKPFVSSFPTAPSNEFRAASEPVASQTMSTTATAIPVDLIAKIAIAVIMLSSVGGLLYFASTTMFSSATASSSQIEFHGGAGAAQRTTKDWLDLVRKDDSSSRGSTGHVLRKRQLQGLETSMIADPAAVKDLIDAAAETPQRGRLREVAEAGLAKFEESSDQPSLEDIVYGLDHTSEIANLWGLRLLSWQERVGNEHLPRVRELVRSENKQLKVAAIGTLGVLQDLPTLLETLQQPDYEIVTVHAIGSMKADAADAVPMLMKRLDDPKSLVARATVEALQKIGPAAMPARDTLLARMVDARDKDFELYADAIVSIDPQVAAIAIEMLAAEPKPSERAGYVILQKLSSEQTKHLSELLTAAEKMSTGKRSLALAIVGICADRAAPHASTLVSWFVQFPNDKQVITQTLFTIHPDLTKLPTDAIGPMLESFLLPTDSGNLLVREAASRSEKLPSWAAGIQSYQSAVKKSLTELQAADAKWKPQQHIHFEKNGTRKSVFYYDTDSQFNDQFNGISSSNIRQSMKQQGWALVSIDPMQSNPYPAQIAAMNIVLNDLKTLTP